MEKKKKKVTNSSMNDEGKVGVNKLMDTSTSGSSNPLHCSSIGSSTFLNGIEQEKMVPDQS